MILDFSKCRTVADVEAVLRECAGELEELEKRLVLLREYSQVVVKMDRLPSVPLAPVPRRRQRCER